MLRTMQRPQNTVPAPAPLYDSGRIAATPSADPNHFPSQLHNMLREINDSGNGWSKIVSWQPHGKCFLIKDKEEFIAKVLPKWFCRLKFTTFERQLHKHGFRKLTRKGPDQGSYYHPKFVRELPEMARTITHSNVKGKRGRKPKAKSYEPDFYNPESKMPSAVGEETVEVARGLASLSASTNLRQDSLPRTPTSIAARAVGLRAQQPSAFDIQARGNHSLLESNTFPVNLPMGSAPSRSSQSFLSPFMQQHDSSSLASTSRTMQAQLQGHMMQQPLSETAASLRNPQHALQLDDSVHAPAPSFGRQSSDFSSVSGLGGGALGGLFGLSDSPPEEAPTFASLESFAAGQASQGQPSNPLQFHYQEHQQRINDLIVRNQQQQRNLQLQQQQLEQQRLELQLRQQQQQDFPAWQANTMGQSVNTPSSSAFSQQQMGLPSSSSNFFMTHQQQLQQYNQQLNQLNQQQSLGLASQQFSNQGQQQQGQGQGQGDNQGDQSSQYPSHFTYHHHNL